MRKVKHNGLDLEWRTFATEIRKVTDDDKPPRLTGLAVPFNRETVLIPADAMFEGSPEIREMIMPGAFTKSLAQSEQWALWAHDPNFVLGRKGNGTLRLTEIDIGLDSEIFPPDTTLVRDMVIAPIERGDVNGMSFRFWVLREDHETREETRDGKEVKVIVFKVREAGIQEVSPTPMPAYKTTTISSRSQERIDDAIEEFQQQRQAALQSAPGHAAHPETEQPEATPEQVDHPEQSAPVDMVHLTKGMYRKLENLQVRTPVVRREVQFIQQGLRA